MLNVLKDNQIYLIDYNSNEIYSHSFFHAPFSFDSVTKLKNKDNIYLFDFIYCLDEDLTYDDCYIGFLNYKIEKKNSFTLEKTNSEEVLKVNYNTKLTCLENNYNNIQCKYAINKDEEKSIYQQIVTLFNRDTFELIQNIILDEFHIDFQTFDSMIQLKENIFIISYSIKPDVIHVLFTKLSLNKNNYILEDYLDKIPYININKDLIYDFTSGNSFRNSLFRLNDDEFVMLINDCKNSK